MAKQTGESDAERFVEKWSRVELSERSASHEHFIDLCQLIGQPTPASADSTGDKYTFEKPVKVTLSASKGSKGESGFVDVWKKGCFAWEYKRKGKYKNLDEAYRQLYQYRDALDNPPLSVVCDIRTTEIRTHFPGYPTEKITIRLEEVPAKLEVFRRVFTNPDSFKPFKKSEEVTADLAKEFSELAEKLIVRYPPGDLSLFQRAGDPVAHFLMKVMFCLFAEDIGALPDKLFTKLVNRCLFDPDQFQSNCNELFEKMKKGGWYGNDRVEYFNGGLFDDAPPLALNHGELNDLARAAQRPWDAVEPSIFGTLFERILDPKKRAQIGAHYTSKDDILLVIEPVIMVPLRRKWAALQEDFKDALAKHDAEPDRKKRGVLATPITVAIQNFRDFLGSQRVLDPACGSGNFLYVALQQLLDLEDEVVRFANKHDIYIDPVPRVRPPQMHGIEINPYAAELAQVVIWIGYLQWLAVHGIADPKRPILDKLQCIENRDAILDLTDKKNPKAAEWPEAEFVVGNPPFLGGSLIWDAFGDEYRASLWSAFDLPRFSDLCCYWFELGSRRCVISPETRIGLLATQGIRGKTNRTVLERVKANGEIFMAWSDRDWVLEGAAVHVSIIGFCGHVFTEKTLNGAPVNEIHSNLTAALNLTEAKQLVENENLSYSGTKKGGDFDISHDAALDLLSQPTNPNGESNLQVLRPWINGDSITRRWSGRWVVDFGPSLSEGDASLFEAPFGHALRFVKPQRDINKRKIRRRRWWLHAEVCPAMRTALKPLARYIVTPRISKYRLLRWTTAEYLADDGVYAFARADDYFFGNLHASPHALWSSRMGTQLEDRPRYTPSTCFETFPLPWPPGKEDVKHPAYKRIAAAAKELNEKRERWLNPPEWIEPLAAKIDAADRFEDVPEVARPLIRQSAIMAAAAKDERLKKRTLTNLYNERPTWLKLAHETLDRAVLAAYAAVDPEGDWSEDWAAAWVDSGAGQKVPVDHPVAGERVKVDQAVLANLLRLNRQRS